LKGIIKKLDHLKDLGVTGAWLSPIFKSPMIGSNLNPTFYSLQYHKRFFADGGYDIEDFKTVNPRFGDNQDLEDLFAKAKELGIKIILDFVGYQRFQRLPRDLKLFVHFSRFQITLQTSMNGSSFQGIVLKDMKTTTFGKIVRISMRMIQVKDEDTSIIG
jgi:glycosidase